MPNTVNSGELRHDAVVLVVKMETIATAQSVFVASPTKGRIVKHQSVIDGALTTSDESITLEIEGTAQSDLALTITQSGSAAGDVDSVDGNADVNVGDAIEIISAGDSGGTVNATFTLTIVPTGV